MADFKRILFPVDFSPECSLAAPHVAAFAREFNATIDVLHVELMLFEPYAFQPHTELLKARLNQFTAENFPGMDVKQYIRIGEPSTEIVAHAAGARTDLIMMPTHGRGMFRRFVLGSVTTKVLHDSPCPVWTSAHLNPDRPPTEQDLANILCAVDLDDVGEHTLRFAGGLARRLGAELTVAHAVPAVEPWPESQFDTEFQVALTESARARLTQMQALAGTSGILCVGSGNIARFIAHAAEAHKAGLVVIGRGGNGMLGRLRTHDYGIIRECACPVLSL